MEQRKEYAMYWGCWVEARQHSVEAACRGVLERFGITARDMEGASCCPDPVVTERLQRELWLALAARNLSIAESMKMDMVTVCNGCYETLFEAREMLKTNQEFREKTEKALARVGKPFPANPGLKHIIDVLAHDIGVEKISKLSANRLNKLNVAIHPGCHLLRSHSRESSRERPKMFEEIVAATGAVDVDYRLKRFCCGYPHRVVEEEFSLKMMLAKKLHSIWMKAADCIVVCCPACNIQFELGQLELKRKYQIDFGEGGMGIPAIHIAELVALGIGMKPEEFGLRNHRGPVQNIISKLG
jgi:heterodisulfide reductase subunit B